MLQILKITAEQTYALRSMVLRPNQEINSCFFEGDELPSTIHIAAIVSNEIVVITSFMLDSKNSIQIRGMATHPDYREQGLAQKVLQHGESLIKRQGISIIWCNAREKAQGFYLKNNYQTIGDYFDIPNIGKHIVMKKNL